MKMHNPNIPSKAFIGKSHLGNYSDCMLELDDNIGKIMDAIRAEAPNTIVILTADNGAWQDAWPDAGTVPFRGEKGSPFEGGFRVPAVMWAPGKIPAGARYGEMMSHIDCWATLADDGRPHPAASWRMEGQRRQADLFRQHRNAGSPGSTPAPRTRNAERTPHERCVRPLTSSRSETISALRDEISATSGSGSSRLISRSSSSAAPCSSLTACVDDADDEIEHGDGGDLDDGDEDHPGTRMLQADRRHHIVDPAFVHRSTAPRFCLGTRHSLAAAPALSPSKHTRGLVTTKENFAVANWGGRATLAAD